MSSGSGIGVWEPKKSVSLTSEKLRRYVEIANRMDPDNLAASLTEDELRDDAILMKQLPEAWQVAEELGSDQVESLVRFFTLAEMQLTGWDGGKNSPVIPLVSILKARDAFDPALRKWIKSNSDNRFLPHGAL